ncbi:MFS transporter [Yinghuangia aomiensis]
MNMQAVAIQAREGRSVVNGFYAAWSVGGMLGAGIAVLSDHKDVALIVMYAITGAITAPAAVLAGRHYLPKSAVPAPAASTDGKPAVPWRVLLPLCAVMTFIYLGDSAVSTWGSVYADKVQHADANKALPYLLYMITQLVGRSLGDLGVRRWGALPVVRAGAVTAAAGFAVVIAAPEQVTALVGFTVLGVGLCTLVPLTFAAGALTQPPGPGRRHRPPQPLQLRRIPHRHPARRRRRRPRRVPRRDGRPARPRPRDPAAGLGLRAPG